MQINCISKNEGKTERRYLAFCHAFFTESNCMDKEKNKVTEINNIDHLIQNALKVKGTKEFGIMLDRIRSFTRYSIYNNLLVYIQNPDVRYFGTAEFWKKEFDREIMIEARSYIILKPRGPVAVVYDLKETIGKDYPDEFIENRGGELAKVNGNFDPLLLDHLEYSLREHKIVTVVRSGFDLEFLKCSPFLYAGHSILPANTQGITSLNAISGFTIQVNHHLKPAEAFLVYIHELAHIILGHFGTYEKGHLKLKAREKKLSQAAEELEAESVSYLIAKELGLTTRSADYLAIYLKDDTVKEEISITRILETCNRIKKEFLHI